MLLNEFLETSAKLFPDKEALVCNGRRFTYREIESSANLLANALSGDMLLKQDRAAVYLDNSPESVVSVFGILKAGGVFVVVNPQVKSKKLEYILNDCQVKVLITDLKHLQAISDILPNCPGLKRILVTDHSDERTVLPAVASCQVLSYPKLLAAGSDKCPEKKVIDIDLASLIYTSGSTGNPKGVMLTHLNMVSAANSITEYLGNTQEDIILSCLPLSFDYGLYQVLMAFKFGGKVILEKAFVYPYKVIDIIIKERVTGFPLVPTMAALLLQLKNLDKYDFSSLRYITNTAQALAPKHIVQMLKLFPDVNIFSMYGLTECKRVSYMPPSDLARKPSSVGKAMPNTEVYIVDDNGRKINDPGVTGELVVRGASVMKGYWNLPEETDKRLKPGPIPNEKLLYTGDYFKMDAEGYLYFISRKDDIIKTAGERVSPKEVENVLYEMDEVLEAAVVSVPDEVLGQAIKAVVVLKEGCSLQEKDIQQHCARNLEPFMIPKFIEFHQSLPKTLTGKIRKTGLNSAAVIE
jgi:amino acid adenylation domain-containing protein